MKERQSVDDKSRVLVSKSTGKVIARRDDCDAGILDDILSPEELEDLALFSESELKEAKRLGVLPETLRGGG